MVSQAPAEEIISTDCRLVSKNLTKRHRQQELRFDWDVAGGTNQVNSLHPALTLLDEVRESEGRLLVHLSLDEVEGVALVQSHHPKEAVLSLGSLWAPVETHFLLGSGLEYNFTAETERREERGVTHITNNIRSFPTKYWSVEICQLTPQFSKVIRHTETVRHCADSVLQEFEATRELRRVVGVGDHSCSDGLNIMSSNTLSHTLTKGMFAAVDEIKNSPDG